MAACSVMKVGNMSCPTAAMAQKQPNGIMQHCLSLERRNRALSQKKQTLFLNSKVWGHGLKLESRACLNLCRQKYLKLRVDMSDEKENSRSPSNTVTEEKEKTQEEGKEEELAANDQKQEIDWKKDEDVKRYLSNPSIETLLKVEAKRTERQLKELESQDQGNVFNRLFAEFRRSNLIREKERLDKAQKTFKALDLTKLKSCFGFDSFYPSEARRFGDGGLFIGNIRRPLEEVRSRLQAKILEAAGREVDIWFLEETSPDGEKKQVCVVQPKSETDLQFESERLSNIYGYVTSLLLGVSTVGTIALVSSSFLQPGATFDDYVSRVLPLFARFSTIIGVSEIATRLTAAKYGVTLSPTFLIPSSWTGCLGAVNNYESLLPNKKALFDIAAARVTSSYMASSLLALIAYFLDGSFNGGDNALVLNPQFFYSNPLLSLVQYFIGPYSDELGNVLPQAVAGVGVPVDPLAFAGLLGIVVTSLNLLPCGKLEGGRITQALFGRGSAKGLSFFTTLLLGFGGLSGSVVSLVWAFVAAFFRGGEELPAQDEITPIGTPRYILGYTLAFICFLSLFPNSAGTFPSPLYTPPFFRGDF